MEHVLSFEEINENTSEEESNSVAYWKEKLECHQKATEQEHILDPNTHQSARCSIIY